MFDLKDKKALVTGASGDIGRAIAETLHGAGAHVALHGTREGKLQEIADALGDGRVSVTPANLSQPEDADSLVPDAVKALGGLDILVNNAGITRDGLILRMKDADWETVMRVNLEAAFRLSRAAMRPMMKSRWGRIVNITSVVGATGNPGQTNYVAAKAGLTGFSKALAQEVASRGITVNCIAPGFIETAMTGDLTGDQKKRILDSIPTGRMGTPAEVAAAALYLASEEAAYVTGATLHVNGGLAMI